MIRDERIRQMKSQIITMVLALAAISGTTLCAQTYTVTGNVPFAFHAGDKDYDAGQYTIIKLSSTAFPLLRNESTHSRVFLSALGGGLGSSKDTKLVFHCYSGHQCFLAEIWPGPESGVALKTSATEKEAAAHNGKREMASIAVNLHPAD